MCSISSYENPNKWMTRRLRHRQKINKQKIRPWRKCLTSKWNSGFWFQSLHSSRMSKHLSKGKTVAYCKKRGNRKSWMHGAEQAYHQVKSAFLLLISDNCSKGNRELMFCQSQSKWSYYLIKHWHAVKVLKPFIGSVGYTNTYSHKAHIHRVEKEWGQEEKERKDRMKMQLKLPLKCCLLKLITPMLIHTYLNGYFACIILNNYKVSDSGFNEKLITNSTSERSQEKFVSLCSSACPSSWLNVPIWRLWMHQWWLEGGPEGGFDLPRAHGSKQKSQGSAMKQKHSRL